MKRYHVHTTISSKHWELLKKHTQKHETQQKVIELALESLENGPRHGPILSPEEQYWLGLAGSEFACLIQKDALKMLINTGDMAEFQEYADRNKPIEYVLELSYQKPLKEFSLKEIVEGLVFMSRMSHWYDTVDYVDDGDYYTIKISHSLGLNLSKMDEVLFKSVFKTYGARAESTISEKTLFMKAYKN